MTKEFYEWIFRTDPKRWDVQKGLQGVDSDLFNILRPYHGKSIKIVDLGCGNGRTLQAIYRPEWDLTGIDYVQEAINIAKEKLGQKVTLIIGDMMQSGLASHSYDVVYSLGAFEHTEFPNFNEPRRIVKNDGIFIVNVPVANKHEGKIETDFCHEPGTSKWGKQFEWMLSKEEWTDKLIESGFNVTQIAEDIFIGIPK